MSLLDILILAGIAVAVFYALRRMVKTRKGGCSRCCGECGRACAKASSAARSKHLSPSPGESRRRSCTSNKGFPS